MASLLFQIKGENRVRGRDVLLQTNREIIAFVMARAPKSLINFLTDRFVDLLKE